MNNEVRVVISDLYDRGHVGVVTLQHVLSPEDLHLVRNTIKANENQFRLLKFGDATRWDLTDEDFQKYPALEFCRRNFRRITESITSVTEINPVYQERFCIQFYPEGSSGVKPHRDTEHSVNCVVIFVISGDNAFFAAKDRACEEVFEFPTRPGDVVIMRGPRSVKDSLPRPIHYVCEVAKHRYVVICRHVNLERLKIVTETPVSSK